MALCQLIGAFPFLFANKEEGCKRIHSLAYRDWTLALPLTELLPELMRTVTVLIRPAWLTVLETFAPRDICVPPFAGMKQSYGLGGGICCEDALEYSNRRIACQEKKETRRFLSGPAGF